MKKHMLWTIMAAALAITGCKSLEPFFARPDLSFETLSVQEISLSQATLVFTFRVHNPNPMGVNLNAVTYDLRIDDRPTARGTLKQGVRLPAASTRSVDLPVTVGFADLIESASALRGRNSVPYVFSGSFNILGFDLPFQTEGILEVPQMPRFSLQSIQIENVGFSGAELNFLLSISNPNPFNVEPEGFDYNIELGGIRFLSGRTKRVPTLSANGATQMNLPATIDFTGLGRAAMQMLSSPSVPYKFSGNIWIGQPAAGKRAYAFTTSGRVPLVR